MAQEKVETCTITMLSRNPSQELKGGGKCPRGEMTGGGKCPRGEMSGGECPGGGRGRPGGKCPGEKSPVTYYGWD